MWMPLILIPPERFRWGNEDVNVADTLYLGKTEVTQLK